MPPERVVARFMEQALAGRPLEVFAAGGHCDYVHVDDVVSLALRAGCGGAPGIYNAGTGVASSLMELATAVADVCQDRPVPVVARSPTGGPLPGFAALDITKAANAWGYAPLGLREGLMRYRRQLEARVSQP
jgi:UDP-glucose 4-epimerase